MAEMCHKMSGREEFFFQIHVPLLCKTHMQQKVALSGKVSEPLIPPIELKASDTKITSKLNKWRDYLFCYKRRPTNR